uniref:Ammonium transporter n=2 Tax=Macrostomum lignano TaxID=282301 RepID=A0A1I8GPP1_9PLAT
MASSAELLNGTLQELKTQIRGTNESLDSFFLCTMAIVVYFMQCGFAFLEAGAVRSKNTTNILIKNILDSFIGGIAYYVIGYGLAFGAPNGNPFCGSGYFAMSYLPESKFSHWFFQFVFAATASTIVSGAVAERCDFKAYIAYSFVITGFLYPIVSHWVWDTGVGWLSVSITAHNGALASTFHDFAGSGVVHVTGGCAAFVAAAILGPRIGRFDDETKKPLDIRGHSVPLASLGGFILFFGFFAFNGGSQLSISNSGDGSVVAIAMVNTILSGSVAAFVTLLLGRIRGPHWSLLQTINGGLAGMVAICAGCDVVYPWGACIIGFFAAISYTCWSMLLLALKISTTRLTRWPCTTAEVSGASSRRGIVMTFDQQSGLFLAVQLVGVLAITAWSGGVSIIVFGILRLLKVFRVSREYEIKARRTMASSAELLNGTLQELKTQIRGTNESLDSFFLCTMAIVVYFMQCGFAFLEAGAVRSKNTTNILIKNILDSFIGGIAYYVIGYGLAFGAPNGNPFCGSGYFAMSYLPESKFSHWFFQFVFAATAATIVSGAVAERCEFLAYITYSFIITGIVYPIVSHWAWDGDIGWLSIGIKAQNGSLVSTYHDFAGSGVVHVTGGCAAFVAAAILGPRIGRFDDETKKPLDIRGHSVPLASLGGFILFFGFFAFNGGSQLSISNSGDGSVVAIAMVNTILSGSVAAFATLLLGRIRGPHWSLLQTINGGLAGMVAICAGCDVVYPWGACIIGFFAAISYTCWSMLLLALKIDDPLDAVAVHYGGGLWGVIAVAFLHRSRGIVMTFDQQSGLDLAVQLVGVLAITAWSGGVSIIVFGILRLLKVFRVSREYEIKGLDFPKHGEMAYPLTAYGHGWKEDNAVPEIGASEMLPEVAINYDRFNHMKQHHHNGVPNYAMENMTAM